MELGKEKGYELVSVLPFNAFFVRRDYYPLFQIECNSPEVLRTHLDDITYLFSGYDGRVFLRGNRVLQQFGIALKEAKSSRSQECSASTRETTHVAEGVVCALPPLHRS